MDYALRGQAPVGSLNACETPTNPNMAGEGTALYISSLLKPFDVKITRLARGLATGYSRDKFESNAGNTKCPPLDLSDNVPRRADGLRFLAGFDATKKEKPRIVGTILGVVQKCV